MTLETTFLKKKEVKFLFFSCTNFFYSELQQNTRLRHWGVFKYRIKGVIFLTQKSIPFIDYTPLNGNRLLVFLNKNYLYGFLSLPYYQFSTNDKDGEIHTEHNFKGFVLSRVP
ncbi:DUF5686 family protein [Tenacibaculum maritimum]|uniref:DUF5686 family protein n=1 Tax=Tenacibaculum maritimum TaxID=107401 RepID=UPI0021CF05A0|nr:DUF5686 family protein [Tenacibaculum maritimum]